MLDRFSSMETTSTIQLSQCNSSVVKSYERCAHPPHVSHESLTGTHGTCHQLACCSASRRARQLPASASPASHARSRNSCMRHPHGIAREAAVHHRRARENGLWWRATKCHAVSMLSPRVSKHWHSTTRAFCSTEAFTSTQPLSMASMEPRSASRQL